MSTVQTYQGVVHEGRILLDGPADLPEGSQVYVLVPPDQVEKPLVDPHIARRRANGWLVSHVGSVMAQQPQLLQLGERLVWQFQAYLTVQGRPPQGPVGTIAVDAYTGEIAAGDAESEELIDRATTAARSLLPPEE